MNDFSPNNYKFSGKERDSESGLGNLGTCLTKSAVSRAIANGF